MRDKVTFVALVIGFATLVTAHVALSVRLALDTRPRWRGVVAFFVAPLAVVWGFQAGFRKTVALWLLALIVYIVALIAALA